MTDIAIDSVPSKDFFYLFLCKLCMKSCLNRSSQQGRNHSVTRLITSVSLNIVLMVLSWESLVFRPSFKESSDHFTGCQSSHTFRKAVTLAFLHLYHSCWLFWLMGDFFRGGGGGVLNWSFFFFQGYLTSLKPKQWNWLCNELVMDIN